MVEQVSKLLLDPENPRLPEEVSRDHQSELFAHFYHHGVLDELMDSMLDNGFFEHEALICLPPNDDGNRVVVEGNRRLATLMLIASHPITEGFEPSREVDESDREQLVSVPIFEAASREEVRRFLGYRHISGLKPWPPEAKARYLVNAVEEAEGRGIENPFLHVAREVGSNTQGVRNSYSALSLLRRARIECETSVGYVLSNRFGVWLRCMNSRDIRDYFDYGSPKTYEEVRQSLDSVNCEHLKEVVDDLTPHGERRKPVLADSRQVTKYGLVLQSEDARDVLRKYGDLELANQIISAELLPDQVMALQQRIDALRGQIEGRVEQSSSELSSAAELLLRAAKLLHASIQALT